MKIIKVEFVISRYEEDLSWINQLENIYSKIIIYNKGSPATFNIPNSEVRMIPNYGMNGYSYLYHVIHNYDTLADITLFTMGSSWSRYDKKILLESTIYSLKEIKNSVLFGLSDSYHTNLAYEFQIDEHKPSNEDNMKKETVSTKLRPCEDRPLGKWFAKHFPNEKIEYVSNYGTVAASREHIHRRPVEFYKTLLEEASYHSPEVEHYFERVWKNIFSIY